MRLIDFDRAKNEIIREIAESDDFHNVVRHICFKNGYTNYSRLIEDIKQEVIEKMLKKDSEDIYNMYVENRKRPFAVAYGIAKKQFLKHPKLKGYNKHSFGEYISFTSNLKNQYNNDLEFHDTTLAYLPDWQDSANANELEEQPTQHIMTYLMGFLEPDEVELLTYEMDKTKTKGKYTKEYREKKQKIFEKIRQIAEDKNIKIVF